ncbi:MAG: hypothetical protein P8Z30_10860, partial [Acidobacteriota bacterium]
MNMAMLGFVAIVLPHLPERQPVAVVPLVQAFILIFSFFALAVLPARFAGTGLATLIGIRPHRGADPSLLFTLSLPARRRTLFFYRTGFCLLAVEGAAILGLAMLAVACARLGGSMQVFTDGWRILFLMVPVYFLDSLLSIRFDAFSVTQIQILGAAGLWFVLPPVARADPLKVVAALSGIAPALFALLTLFVA